MRQIQWVTPETSDDSLDCIGPSVLQEQGYEVFCVAQGQAVADPDCLLVVRVDLMADTTVLWQALCEGAQPAILVVRDAAQSARVIEILAACRTFQLPAGIYAMIMVVGATEPCHGKFHRHRPKDRLPAAAVAGRLA